MALAIITAGWAVEIVKGEIQDYRNETGHTACQRCLGEVLGVPAAV